MALKSDTMCPGPLGDHWNSRKEMEAAAGAATTAGLGGFVMLHSVTAVITSGTSSLFEKGAGVQEALPAKTTGASAAPATAAAVCSGVSVLTLLDPGWIKWARSPPPC
jgi:hypothetical protein